MVTPVYGHLISEYGLLLQSSTVEDLLSFSFSDGVREFVRCSYIEFAEGLILPEFENLPEEEVGFYSGMASSQYPDEWLTYMTDLWSHTWFKENQWKLMASIIFFIYVFVYLMYMHIEISRERRRLMAHREAIRSMLASSCTPILSTDEEIGQIDSSCTICRVGFIQGENVVSLPECIHTFHFPCIEGYWIQAQRATCPNCRHEYISRDHDSS